MQALQELIKEACDDAGEDFIQFRNDYSGRGMYGAKCVGITGTMAECQLIIAQVIKGMGEDLSGIAQCSTHDVLTDAEYEFGQNIGTLMNFTMDSMGMGGVILYWPGLEPISEDEPENDGQPDEAQEWHDFDPDC
jgi:hypothetical protein